MEETGDLQTFLNKLINRVSGLQAVVVSDREGVALMTASKSGEINESAFAATFALASEQASKLRMGKNKTITSFYENKVIVHINHLPLVISLIGDNQLNVGVLLSFASDIKKALEPLKNSIKETSEEMS